MSSNFSIIAIPSALQQSGLGRNEFSSESVHLKELTDYSISRLRCYAGQKKSPPGLPESTGHCLGDDPAVLCLRPGEWLWISESAPPGELLERAAGDVDREHGAVYNLTDGLAVFRLSGSGSGWLLSKLSGLDFLAGAGGGAHCARTRMGHIAVVVHYRRSGDGLYVFDLIFDRGYARYFWELLTASAPHADDLVSAFGGSE